MTVAIVFITLISVIEVSGLELSVMADDSLACDEILQHIDQHAYGLDKMFGGKYDEYLQYVIEYHKHLLNGFTHIQFYENYLAYCKKPDDKILQMLKDIEQYNFFIVVSDTTHYFYGFRIMCTKCWNDLAIPLWNNGYLDIHTHVKLHDILGEQQLKNIIFVPEGVMCKICHVIITDIDMTEKHLLSHRPMISDTPDIVVKCPSIMNHIYKIDAAYYCDICRYRFSGSVISFKGDVVSSGTTTPLNLLQLHLFLHEEFEQLISNDFVSIVTNMIDDHGSYISYILCNLCRRYKFKYLYGERKDTSEVIKHLQTHMHLSKIYSHAYSMEEKTGACCADCNDYFTFTNNHKCRAAEMITPVKKKLDDTLLSLASAHHDRLGRDSPMSLLPQFVLRDIANIVQQNIFDLL